MTQAEKLEMRVFSEYKAVDSLRGKKWTRIEVKPFPDFRCHYVTVNGEDYRVKRMDYKRERIWVLPA